jgi:hypothetical protein
MKYVISESQYQLIKEQPDYVLPAVTLSLIRKMVVNALVNEKEIDLNKIKRRMNLVDEFAFDILDQFHVRLEYIGDDNDFQKLARQLEE